MINKLEKQIQKEIINYLQILENRGQLYFVRNNSFEGKFKRRNGSEGYIKNNKKGTPDILVCYSGIFIGFEVKTKTGKQSPYQKIAEQRIKNASGKYFIVRSVSDVVNTLENKL